MSDSPDCAEVVDMSTRETLAPEAIEALARHTATEQQADRGVLERLCDSVAGIERRLGEMDDRIKIQAATLDRMEKALGRLDKNVGITNHELGRLLRHLITAPTIPPASLELDDPIIEVK